MGESLPVPTRVPVIGTQVHGTVNVHGTVPSVPTLVHRIVPGGPTLIHGTVPSVPTHVQGTVQCPYSLPKAMGLYSILTHIHWSLT